MVNILEPESLATLQRAVHGGDLILNTTNWRRFARQPGGITTMLLLTLLLALRVHACPMPSNADPIPATTHSCCHDAATTPDLPASSTPSPCHDGPCPQALNNPDELVGHLSSASEPDRPAPVSVAEWLPPDWSDRDDFPPDSILAVSSAPSQRSLILRL